MNRSAPSPNELTDAWTDSDASADPVPAEELLTVHDAARFLNVSVSWIYEHTRDHVEDRLPFLKLGKYVRFDRADLRAYVDAKRRAARTRHARR
jgi:excisionase family DNA binding protein